MNISSLLVRFAIFVPSRLCVKSIGISRPNTVVLAVFVALVLAAPALADPAASTASASKPANGHADSDWTAMLFVFMLASFIGLGVVTRVSRLLHTPLMSITNAISAIAVVGAITVAGAATTDEHPLYLTILGAVALFASMTNIVSGFLITDRMLKMFKKQEAPKT